MKAAVFYGPKQPLVIEDVEVDKPLDREVLVRTVASGVCHSDLHFVDGYYSFPAPAVLGHEGAGIVEVVGQAVDYVKPGDHIICCLSVFCGFCDDCMSGHPAAASSAISGRRPPKDARPVPRSVFPEDRTLRRLNEIGERSAVAARMAVAFDKVGGNVFPRSPFSNIRIRRDSRARRSWHERPRSPRQASPVATCHGRPYARMEAWKHSRTHSPRKPDRLTACNGEELGLGDGIGVVE